MLRRVLSSRMATIVVSPAIKVSPAIYASRSNGKRYCSRDYFSSSGFSSIDRPTPVVIDIDLDDLDDDDDDDDGDYDEEDKREQNKKEKRRKLTSGNYKFIDRSIIEVHGGRGGNGCVSFERLGPTKKRPNGGNGGKGGSVYIVADKACNNLNFETHHFTGGDGRHGGSDGLTGRGGKDVYIRVPLGTIITERFSEEYQELLEGEDLGYDNMSDNAIDLDQDKMVVLVAEGGAPGIGNKVLVGSKSLRVMSVPQAKTPGGVGAHKSVHLELKLIAEVGLVGYPNAGKSTLLKALSNAKPKIAPYPFTTLHPNIGIIEYSDLETVSVADIPGLIDGAHEDRGLGHDFLKHIERTKILLFVIDISGLGGDRDPLDDLKSLRNELFMYDPLLADKPAMVFANKTDLKLKPKKAIEKLVSFCAEQGLTILRGSADKMIGMPDLAITIRKMVEEKKGEDAKKNLAIAAALKGKSPKEIVKNSLYN